MESKSAANRDTREERGGKECEQPKEMNATKATRRLEVTKKNKKIKGDYQSLTLSYEKKSVASQQHTGCLGWSWSSYRAAPKNTPKSLSVFLGRR